MHKSFLFIFLFFLLFISCKKETEPIEAELAPYIDRFVEEANKRGHRLNLEDMEAYIVPEIVSNGTILCGQGFAPVFGDSFRGIAISGLCWSELDESGREILVFHELGHALLERQHRNTILGIGRKQSIMFSGSNCVIEDSYDLCQTELRSYYLDELFAEPDTLPNWSDSGLFTTRLFTDEFDEPTLDWVVDTDNSVASNGFTLTKDSSEFISAPYSLKFTQTTANTSAAPFWKRDIPYRGFKFCSNLKVSGNIKTKNLEADGYLEIITIIPDSTNTSFCSYALQIPTSANSATRFEPFNYDINCIPIGKREIEVKFRLQGNEGATVYVDNLILWIFD